MLIAERMYDRLASLDASQAVAPLRIRRCGGIFCIAPKAIKSGCQLHAGNWAAVLLCRDAARDDRPRRELPLDLGYAVSLQVQAEPVFGHVIRAGDHGIDSLLIPGNANDLKAPVLIGQSKRREAAVEADLD